MKLKSFAKLATLTFSFSILGCSTGLIKPTAKLPVDVKIIAMNESFFSSLKSELIKKKIYQTRSVAKSEIFEYIEEFYNRVRRHKHLSQLSPLAFEQRQIAL